MMQTKGHLDIPVASIAKDITVNVRLTGFRRWHLRLRLGLALMRLAIWVSGMGFKVEGPKGPELDGPRFADPQDVERRMCEESARYRRQQDALEGPEDASNGPS